MAMAPRPFSPSAPPFLLLLLLFARSSGADNADADTPAHEAMPNDRAQPASLPHHLQAPPSLLTPSSPSGVGTGGDPNHSQRVADDDEGNGFMKGDEWKGSWGQRRRRGQGNAGRGLNEEGMATAPRQSCKDLRSKRYISDGFCTSARPLIEAVCAEKCCGPTAAPNRNRPRNRHHKYRSHHSASPVSLHRSASNPHLQPWYADYVKVWARGQNEMNSVISASVAASDDAAEDEDKGDGVDEEGEDGGDAVEWRCVEDAVRRRRVRLICRDGTRRTYHVKLVKSCKCVQRRRRRRRGRRRKGRRRLGRIGSWASRRMGREAD